MLNGILQAESTNVIAPSNSIGANIINGISAGIQASLSALMATMTAGMSSLFGAATGYLGIASPSKLFKEKISANIALGVGAGIDEEMPYIINDAEKYFQSIIDSAERSIRINLNPLSNMNRQTVAMESVLASSDQSNNILSKIADFGSQSVTPNVSITLEPAGDMRGFFEYISAGVKRVDYLSGKY